MTFEAVLKNEHSRRATDLIINAVQNDPIRIHELMDCFFDKEYRLCQRAAWPVGILGEQSPELLIPYLPQMIENIKTPKHDAIVRNTVRTWQTMYIPEAYQGEVFELCFQHMIDPKVAIAIRAFSMTVCANIAMLIPELKEEVSLAIQDQLETGSAGIVSRGQNILKKLATHGK